MDYSAHHRHRGSDPSSQTVYRHQGIDPPAQPQPFYNHSTEDYYSLAFSNPQLVNTQPYPFHILNVQPPQHGQQEPNPPEVAVPPPPPQHDPNSSYRSLDYCAAAYSAVLQQGGLDSGLAMVHQPLYMMGSMASTNGVAHPRISQTHPVPIPSFSAHPYSGHGHGRGCSQPRPQSFGPSLVPLPVPLMSQAQSAPLPKYMCELCKVECSSPEMLNQHNSGKKHLKKLKSFGESQQLPQESSLPSQNINEVEERKVEEAKSLGCELCKAYCNTLEIFNSHLNGKKHQKKLKMFEKLNKSQIDAQTEQRVSEPELKPEVPSQPEQESLPSEEINEESKVAVEKQQVEGLGMESTEQAGGKVKACGTKRKMRGCKVSKSVRSKGTVEPPQPKEAIPLQCELCNIKCESQVAFHRHIMGKKHFSNAKRRFLSENETLGQEVFDILKQAIQTLHEQNVSASPTFIMTSELDHHHQGLLLSQMDLQAQALEPNLERACVEDISEQPLLPAESNCPTGQLVSSETS